MFITRECDYAVRVIRALKGGKKLSVNEICEKEAVTAPFAYKILKKLQRAGIVKGFRGARGGYALKKPLKELTLLEIYQAIDPKLFLIECLDDCATCERCGEGKEACAVYWEMMDIQKEVWVLLSRKTMAELLTQHS
jgi:Rrf2 family protein